MKLKNILKVGVGVAAAAALALTLVGCGSSNNGSTESNEQQPAELSGTISTNGSTSMEKVIGSLSEEFMAGHEEAEGRPR